MRQIFNRLLGTSFDVRKGEGALVLMMFSNYFIILAAYYMLKPLRDAEFLKTIGTSKLPLVYILVAIFSATFVALYNKYSQRVKFIDIITYASIVIILSLVVMGSLIDSKIQIIYYLFYVWVSVLEALITSQFWIFANTIFDASQAKRVFSILGIGGI